MLNEIGASLLAYCVSYDPPSNTPEFLMLAAMRLTLLYPKLHNLDIKRASINDSLTKSFTESIDQIMARVLVCNNAFCLILFVLTSPFVGGEQRDS